MKFLTLLAVLAAGAAAAHAQEPAPVKPADEKSEAPSATKPDLKPTSPDSKPVKASELKPTPPDLPTLPAPSEEDLSKGQPGPRLKIMPNKDDQLLPDNVPTNKKPPIIPGSTADRGKTRTTLKPPVTANDLDLRIRFRKAQSRAASEPSIKAAWEESRTAVTDYDKRAAMKSYYNQLFKRMLAMDKDIKPIVEDRQRYALRRLEQTRVDPTDPLDEDNRLRRD